MIGGGGINTKAIAAVSSWVIRNSSCIFFPDVVGSLSIVVFQDFSEDLKSLLFFFLKCSVWQTR